MKITDLLIIYWYKEKKKREEKMTRLKLTFNDLLFFLWTLSTI